MGPNEVLDKGFITDTAVTKFYGVRLTDIEHVAIANTLGQEILGFAQEGATASDAVNGRVINVRVMGITRAITDGARTLFERVRIAADGRVTALAGATANQNQVGICLTPVSAANDQIDLLLTVGARVST